MFQMQNMDPLVYFFRNQAAKRFLDQRAKLAAAQRSGQAVAPPANGSIPQQPRSVSQNPVPAQVQQGTPQMFDPSFAGNMDQFLGQQQDAMRSQEAGQVVVPASNGQVIPEQQRGNPRAAASQQQNAQLGGGNHPSHLPQHGQYWANPSPNPTMHQTPAPQMQQAQMNFGNVSQHTGPGQMGGHNSSTGRMPPQNPTMPNLNKALGNSPQTQALWQQRPPQSNLSKEIPLPAAPQGSQLTGLSQQEMQQRQKEKLHNHLAALKTDEDRREFIVQFQQHAQRQRLLQQQQQQIRMLPNGPDSEPMQPQKSQNSAQVTGQGLLQPVPKKSGANEVNGSLQPASQQQQPPVANVVQQPPAQPPQKTGNPLPQGFNLTEDQARQMDGRNFPLGILNVNSALSQLPQDVKSWGQLKAWVAQNDSKLPPGSLTKLRGLQGLHFQQIALGTQRRVHPNMGTSHLVGTQGLTQPLAPTAPMVPPRNNGKPLTGTNSSVTGPHMMQVPQPTIQEIQAARAKFGENAQEMSDHQLGLMIMRNRRHEVMKAAQAQQQSSPQQAAYHNLPHPQHQPPMQQLFPPSTNQGNQAPQPATVPRSQPTQTARSTATPKDSAVRQALTNRTAGQGQSNQKGVKRNSDDDVVEVPKPNGQHDTHPKPQPSGPPRPNVSQNGSEPAPTAPMDAKAMLEAQRRMQAAQRQQAPPFLREPSGPNGDQHRTEESAKFELRLKQMIAEVAQNTPIRPPVLMDAQTRRKMVKKLQEAKTMVQRLESSLLGFIRMFPDENSAKDLIRTVRVVVRNVHSRLVININQRVILLRQYQDTQNFTPVEQLTITSEELDQAIENLTQYFHHIMKKFVKAPPQPGPRQQPLGQPTNQAQRQPPVEQVLKEPASSLSAANLQQHQQAMQSARQASVQKSHNSSRAPAAPTSPQPPFSFTTQSPQGLAKYPPDRPNGLTQDKLSLPSTKRRKNNPPPSVVASPPIPASGTLPSKSQPVTKNVTQGVPPAHPPVIMIKCPVPNCHVAPKGFAAQADLDKHMSEVHEPKEPQIDDPLPWALEQMRAGLNLDESGHSISRLGVKNVKGLVEAPKMKASTSAQGQSAVKQETSTPMTRVPTQTGPSPASNLLKTPQASANIKTPASEVKSSSKEGKTTESKPSASLLKEPTASPDPWSDSLIPSAAITEAWSSLADIQPEELWTTSQNTLTPASTLSSSKSDKNSPRDSDIGENDVVKINIAINDDQEWKQPEWLEVGLFGDMELLNMNQDFLSMDWDSPIEAGEIAATMENESRGKRRRGSEADDLSLAAAPEWLNIYAVDNMDQTTG